MLDPGRKCIWIVIQLHGCSINLLDTLKVRWAGFLNWRNLLPSSNLNFAILEAKSTIDDPPLVSSFRLYPSLPNNLSWAGWSLSHSKLDCSRIRFHGQIDLALNNTCHSFSCIWTLVWVFCLSRGPQFLGCFRYSSKVYRADKLSRNWTFPDNAIALVFFHSQIQYSSIEGFSHNL